MQESDSKKKLLRFIEQIISSALGTVKYEFLLIDSLNDEIPEKFSSIPLTQEFLICVKCQFCECAKEKLQQFLRKEVIEIQKNIIYVRNLCNCRI